MYRHYLMLLIGTAGNLPLDKVTIENAERHLALRSALVADSSLSVEMRTLKSAFNIFMRLGFIPDNPFKDCLVRVDERFPVYLTRLDYDILMSSIRENWFRDLVTAAVFTGMRRGELLALLWTDVHLDEGYIAVQSRGNFRTKKGRARAIPLHPVMKQLFRSADRKKDHVFRQVKGRWASELFRRYVAKCRLNPEFHFHSLRHTFGSWLVQSGVPIYEVMELMGHTDIKITKRYAHLDMSRLSKSIAMI